MIDQKRKSNFEKIFINYSDNQIQKKCENRNKLKFLYCRYFNHVTILEWLNNKSTN